MITAASVSKMLRSRGRTVTLRRLNGTARTATDVTVVAFISGFREQGIADALPEADRTAIISNTEIAAEEWPGPPIPGDEMIVGTTTYRLVDCETHSRDDVGDVRHKLTIRGA